MIQIYHNPSCEKSRNCLAFIKSTGKEYEIIKYLENPPRQPELLSLLKKLKFKPLELVGQKEKIWIENFKNTKMTEEAIIQTLVSYPILIERPIVAKDDKALIGRYLDKITHFLK
jgi:arsenate reductase